ncbi:hypothetical protein J4E90_007825 [Alternaria incomplexa]|uniref:uncharacterized protein n=2 Tax=Alternaria sect. Infectoriae TaxID=2499258 RepID=UPI0022206AD4|nr:uncharacterized protein J4E90_007825 [Alternaria incomplexa]KAI4910390.1 hypothetical protein J4E90_007825 [Alternaria incomplexa]
MEPSSSREPPWAEHEKVYLLAEVLKAAPIPSHVLFQFIRDANIQPRWNDMALPPGRSITDALSYLPQWCILRPTSRENDPISKKPPRPLAAYYNLDPPIPTLEILCLPALPTHLL